MGFDLFLHSLRIKNSGNARFFVGASDVLVTCNTGYAALRGAAGAVTVLAEAGTGAAGASLPSRLTLLPMLSPTLLPS